MQRKQLREVSRCVWEIPATGRMRVPARIYASEAMIDTILADNAPEQAVNVACLPGIVKASLAMPDIHWGYGFPIGGVAAFDCEEGVISPGGVGYDINCGVRLMTANVTRAEVEPHVQALLQALYKAVPAGVGAGGADKLSRKALGRVATEGARWAVAQGWGSEADLACIEESGCLAGAAPAAISDRAWKRGADQVGTLGSGNHFLELGSVDEVLAEDAAEAFGLARDQVTLLIHCGSRGFGHQVCDDFLADMVGAAAAHGVDLPDRQLACAPVRSDEGRAYLGAMACAVNYAFANRQAIAHRARQVFNRVLGMENGERGLRTVYEVAHNIAKLETHTVDGRAQELCVHRKGATRAFAPARPEVPEAYRTVGQPVLVPGDMGRCSYVLAGTDTAMAETFGSTCHGAGRALSRKKAAKAARGRNIVRELGDRGVRVQSRSKRTLAEEMPEAYKDVNEVVAVCERAGLSRIVARIRPLGCIKG